MGNVREFVCRENNSLSSETTEIGHTYCHKMGLEMIEVYLCACGWDSKGFLWEIATDRLERVWSLIKGDL